MAQKGIAGDGSDLVAIAQGFFRGKVLSAAVRLGVCDVLAGGPLSSDEIAERVGAEPSGMRRLLRALVAMGVVVEDNGVFALTDVGERLRREAEGSVWADIVFWADLLDDAWTYLPDCVRAGGTHGAAAARQRQGTVSRWDCVEDASLIFRRVSHVPRKR